MADVPSTQEESGCIAHAMKCGRCEKNNQPGVGVPGQMCTKCTQAKIHCDKLRG